MDRLLELAERAYVGADNEDLIVASQLKNFFTDLLHNVDIKMEVFKEQPVTLETAYEKELAKSKLRHRVGLDLGREHGGLSR